MKKWVLLILVAGFIMSNKESSKVKTENIVPDGIGEKVESSQNEVLSSSFGKEGHHFLLLTLDNKNVRKAVIAKISDGSQTMGVATLSNEQIEQVLSTEQVDLQTISKDSQIKYELETHFGFPINNVIAVEKNGYIELFARIFPDGIALQLSDEMKKDLKLVNQSKKEHVKAEEFFKIMKTLKQTQKYDQEINQLIVDTFTSQLSKPEASLALFGFVTDLDEYFYTDLTMNQLLTMGINMMKNPVQEVQKLEVPMNPKQEVIKPIEKEMKHF
ncbi:hypothetical protein [Pseudoneobacillus rhizosphaerae]|uniref:Uncharacterized protein n=1 Tax=Pseudoneobacillus rhizosphaerae TaxID=2880968 RepID=A0A9C7LB85_9BACI|nr:hypothetical protein [Pseudoneobacillus rhizosphaerae]CAG9609886.1 hypothetical protein NEOCIP111885_03629 [Pseudoneobacillus rhizosphaerae]